MKYCPKCGAQLNDDARFCAGCGAVQPTSAGNSVPDGKKEKKKTIWVIAAVVALCIVALLICWRFGVFGVKDTAPDQTPTQTPRPQTTAAPTKKPQPSAAPSAAPVPVEEPPQAAAAPVDWQARYNELLDEAMSENADFRWSCCYSLYDLDKNGVPELFLKQGTCEADYEYSVFSVDETETPGVIGTLPGGHSCLGGLAAQNEMLLLYMHMGYEQITKVRLSGGRLEQETVIAAYALQYQEIDPLAQYELDDRSGLDWHGDLWEDNQRVLEHYDHGFPTDGMTAEMAEAYAALLRAEPHAAVRGAVFDGGGVPVLWLAYGDEVEYGEYYEALCGDYGDQVYVYQNGEVVRCTWITSLLRDGKNAVIAQSWVDEGSDLQDDFRLYKMTNGHLAPTPFAEGMAGINGAVVDGKLISAPEEYLSLHEIYQRIDPELEILLDASSGLADMLFLRGEYPWYDGYELAMALMEYAYQH